VVRQTYADDPDGGPLNQPDAPWVEALRRAFHLGPKQPTTPPAGPEPAELTAPTR
jgi:hypothetical protein